jgi:hypothetical protein
MSRVFISCSLHDRVMVEILARELKLLGVDVFNPVADIALGASARDAVKAAMKASDVVVVALGSLEGLNSSWISYEVGMAEALGMPVIVVGSLDIAHNPLPAELASYTQHIKLFKPDELTSMARFISHQVEPAALAR